MSLLLSVPLLLQALELTLGHIGSVPHFGRHALLIPGAVSLIALEHVLRSNLGLFAGFLVCLLTCKTGLFLLSCLLGSLGDLFFTGSNQFSGWDELDQRGLTIRSVIKVHSQIGKVIVTNAVGQGQNSLFGVRSLVANNASKFISKLGDGTKLLHALSQICEHGLIPGVDRLFVKGIEVWKQNLIGAGEDLARSNGFSGRSHVAKVHLDLGLIVSRLALARNGTTCEHMAVSCFPSLGVVGRINIFSILEQKRQAALCVSLKSSQSEVSEFVLGVVLVLLKFEQPLSSGLDDNLPRFRQVALCPACSLSYLVVNIGNVHDKLDLEAKVVHQDTTDNVCRDIVASMTQVTLVVYGRTAGIPRDLALLDRDKWHWGAGLERIVEL
ncbi:hypothetical protein HG531_006558 [Fusarium graminearum]|nr:hypothetical protein HG531_006558 [Fusarium graminearum]